MMKKMIVLLTTAIVMIFGCMSFPAATETADQNNYDYTMQDVKNLQNFLLSEPTEENLKDKPYDLNGDDIWDVFDLCMMKREVLKQMEHQNNTLVVYFSRTGNTEKIAEYIIDLTNADSYVIEAAIPYTDSDIRYQDNNCRANKEQNDKTVRPEIAEPIESIDSYDVIYLGYPIWWGEEPRIIDTFLESYDFSDKIVVPFCTSASSGNAASEKNIAALVPIGNLLEGKRFSANTSQETVKAWLNTLEIPEKKVDTKMNINVNGKILTATLEKNSSADALVKLLENGSVTIDMSDYANFEKVGELPHELPRNDEQLDTNFGDLILYLGKRFVIYYDKNSWNFTKLGHIDDVTQEELKSILGDGDVIVELSLTKS